MARYNLFNEFSGCFVPPIPEKKAVVSVNFLIKRETKKIKLLLTEKDFYKIL
jgi:hypothetical protein